MTSSPHDFVYAPLCLFETGKDGNKKTPGLTLQSCPPLDPGRLDILQTNLPNL
jgi:hypothetical protein